MHGCKSWGIMRIITHIQDVLQNIECFQNVITRRIQKSCFNQIPAPICLLTAEYIITLAALQIYDLNTRKVIPSGITNIFVSAKEYVIIFMCFYAYLWFIDPCLLYHWIIIYNFSVPGLGSLGSNLFDRIEINIEYNYTIIS